MSGSDLSRTWLGGLGGLGDPLAGLPEPAYAPGPLREVARAQTAAAGHLRALAARLRAAVGGQVGGAWVGPAAASASASGQQLAATHDGAAVLAEQTSGVLDVCAGRWEQAHATYAHARRLAHEALAQEAAHRAAGAQAVQAHPAAGDLTGTVRAGRRRRQRRLHQPLPGPGALPGRGHRRDLHASRPCPRARAGRARRRAHPAGARTGRAEASWRGRGGRRRPEGRRV